MEIDLLGRFDVRLDGRAVDVAEFGGRRVRQLVRMLAADRGHVISRDSLIEALWGETPPADPATNLNVVVNRARRALREPDVIQTVDGGYMLRRDAGIVVDVEEFEKHATLARDAQSRGDLPAASSVAQIAMQLWAEPLPEDAYADWARIHRDRLERTYQEVLEVAATAKLAMGRPGEAVNLASEAAARQPLREAARVLLIQALAADGDQAAAITAYLDLRRMLADELGVDPSAEASALYEQLLHGAQPIQPVRQSRCRDDAPPLVGREIELDLLADAVVDGRIALVSGRSGSGKSRLLQDLCLRIERPIIRARAVLPEREDPWSLVRALLETPTATTVDISRLLGSTTVAAMSEVLPELDASQEPVDSQSRRALIQQGVIGIFRATAPSMLIVDDLQWADSSSLDALALLASRDLDIAMVLAYRPEEVPVESPVAHFLSVVSEVRPLELPLGPLDAASLSRLIRSTPVAKTLAEHTDGTPFAVLQAVRILERDGMLRRTTDGGWELVGKPDHDRVRDVARAGQRAIVWRHFERQPPHGRDLLAALALLGRPVPVRLLSSAFDLDLDDAMRVLGDLARNHLVRHDTEGFRVDHDMVGETIQERLDPVTRARLHHQLAATLELSDGPVDELARHLTGAGDLAAAAAAYARAAKARMDRFADREAAQLASEGLALDPAVGIRTALLEVRAETSARQGDLAAARRDLREALTGARAASDRARLLTRLAELTAGAEDILRASELADLALAEAGDDRAARARALYVRALVDMNMDRRELSKERFDQALALFTELGDAAGMADILDARAMTTFGFGDILTGIAEFDRVAKLFGDSGNLLRVVTPRSTRGHGLMFAGRPQEGLDDTSQALELARSLGYAEGEAMVLWHHAEVLVACGQYDDGLNTARLGVDLAQRLGHRGWTATAWRAVGIALQAQGDLQGARAAFEVSLETSGEHLIMFRCWAHARLAMLLLALGHQDEAAQHAQAALDSGPALAQYEARLARCELAVARGDADSGSLVDEAHGLAVAGGHYVSATRLEQLRNEVGAGRDPV